MKRPTVRSRAFVGTAVFCLAYVLRLTAQTTAPEKKETENEETLVLSPFIVDASEDANAYQAKSTLAGTRVRTDLKDVASSITVVTAQFLQDTGAKNSADLLVYTPNTEVGGIQGNFAGYGNAYINGASENNLLKPSNRVRGLDSADNTRDFFQSDIPWDSFNVGRVDLQRGPNSILFGIGSPAGIINTSINTATFKNEGTVENRLGSFGSVRSSLDVNRVILKNELSIRFSGLYDDTKYRQSFTFNDDRRLFGALRWDPKLFADTISTSLRVNYDNGRVKANRPRTLPPQDRITPYFDPTGINKRTYDPYYAWASGQVSYSSSALLPGEQPNFWVVQTMGPGINAGSNPVFAYNNAASATPALTSQGGPSTYYGLNTDGTRGGGIDGFPYGSNIGIAGFADFAQNYSRYATTGDPLPAADKGFYKNFTLSDPTIFDFYNELIDGPNKKEWQNWDAFNLALSQTFLDNRVGYEVVYDRQKYDDGASSNLSNPFVSVDIRRNLMDYPERGPMPVKANPNVHRAFVGSNVGGGNYANDTDRKNFRATAFGEFRASDFMGKSLLSDVLGRQLLTALYSTETYDVQQQNWTRYAVDSTWSAKLGGFTGTGGFVALDWITYLSPSLVSAPSAKGLQLTGITAVQSPTGSFNIPYYDSHWAKPTNPSDPNYVNPAAPWFNATRPSAANMAGSDSTQSENPQNYVGWVDQSYNVLNADNGDRNRLLTSTSNLQKVTRSKAVTLQSYFWDETFVATFGARNDRLEQRAGSSSSDLTSSGGAGVADPNPPLQPLAANAVSEGNNVSWGVVLHTPKAWREALPWGTTFSVTYNDSRNTRVETRYGFDGMQLPNATGRTRDVGLVVSTLNDKLQFKIVRYKTTVENANISSVSSETATLGSQTYYIKNLEAWGTASALYNLAGREVDGSGNSLASGNEWYWNWALVDSGWDGTYNSPTSDAFKNHPSTIQQTKTVQSWLSQLLPQSWFDAYGYPVNVAAAAQGDWRKGIAGYTATSGTNYLYPSGTQPSGGGRINGSWPTGTVNNMSEGWEFEIVGQPIDGLNVSINASKQHASQVSLGESLSAFVEAQHEKYMTDAGLLRLWWGGDSTVRQYFNTNIWSAYQFQLQTNGKLVSEMSPWTVNSVANYNFKRGLLKGVNVGGAYRWRQGTILGYHLNAAKDNLDVENPYWGKPEAHFDFWAGYSRKLSEKLNWRVQLNLRNVGENPHLRTFSIQPDGTTAMSRIQEGMTWQLTNSITF